MPFTISHAAAVLPLKKSPLPLAALMIGSMSPDFSYFLPMSLANTSWHNLRRGEPRASNPREARSHSPTAPRGGAGNHVDDVSGYGVAELRELCGRALRAPHF